MILHPLESLDLIFQPIVQASLLLNFLTSKKTVWSNTVIEGDDHDIQLRGLDQARTVVILIRQRRKSPALNEKVHWKFLI
jgi:hypothetical protein